MSIRRLIFWLHLSAGVSVGLVVLLMSATGVLLAYERQIIAFAEHRAFAVEAAGRQPLGPDELADAARRALGEDAALVLTNDPDGPVKATAGRREGAYLDPYTGEVLGAGVEGVERFFGSVTALHRWLALEGEARSVGRAVTGAANLVFLFIAVSGLVLWWPRRWRWPLLKTHLVFRRGLPTAKARDYNWHHVFGVWALVPLVLVVVSGTVISYPWASDLVYRVYGEEPVRGRGAPGAAVSGGAGAAARSGDPDAADPLPLERALEAASDVDPSWRTMTVTLPRSTDDTITVTLDRGNGAQAALRQTAVISRADGAVLSLTGNESATPGRRARTWMRFVHTGEVYGLAGQTVAALASLAACFLVWTGLALAWRRLVQPLLRRSRAARPVPTREGRI
ncbi:PepSY domain-containing protein [Acuticoccus sediminis]|uniref:PepSY domain-containing protein n=1 Tax=Acuticoccus sediminis TaxID=2184697 RepID=A0A8B2NU23_9HYPH|nr:PepSY-associated TM helix domain-containing protein [Acuticoccus sediminis]RAI02471.1 PepSY domain-containing protein [Acuticoccus sediminis]